MARILIHWLNEEVQLSREVTSLSEDFKNGYLLGELLHKYNQQRGFEMFLDTDTPDAKIMNYCLLEPTMRNIGVFFNSKIAMEIMEGKPGTMKTLLYEIRTVLSNAKKSPVAGSGDKKEIFQIIHHSRPLYDQTMSITFENAIRSMVENPNDLLMARATAHFTQKNDSFRESVSSGHSATMSALQFELQRTKQIARQKKQHEREFQQSWELMNINKWKKNQTIAHERVKLENKIKADTLRKKVTIKVTSNNNARDMTFANLDEFDNRMKNQIARDNNERGQITLKSAGGEPGTGIAEMTYLDNESLYRAMVENKTAMKEAHDSVLHRQQVHDRRRKRFVRERESHHAQYLQNNANDLVHEQLLTLCQSEEVENLSKLRTFLYKRIFAENEKNREKVVGLQVEKDEIFAQQWIKQQAEQEVKWVIPHAITAQEHRLSTLKQTKEAARMKEVKEIAAAEVDRVLDVVDWVCCLRAVGEFKSQEDVVPQSIWRDVRDMYLSTNAIASPLPLPQHLNVCDVYPRSLSWRPLSNDVDWLSNHLFAGNNVLSTDADAIALLLNATDAKNFVNSIASFACDVSSMLATDAPPAPVTTKKDDKKDKKGSADATDAPLADGIKVIPPDWISNTQAGHLLGEIILNIRSVSRPVPAIPNPPSDLPSFTHSIALCGESSPARKALGDALSTALDIAVVSAEQLLQDSLARGKELYDDEIFEDLSQYDEVALTLYSEALEGLPVQDDFYVALIILELMRISDRSGYVLIDFPKTYAQCAKLVTALTTIDFDAHMPQVTDLATPLAEYVPREHLTFADSASCGLSKFIYLSSQADVVMQQRMRLRNDYSTGKEVHLTKNMQSVATLAEVRTPQNPTDTLSLLLETSSAASVPLLQLAQRLNILQSYTVDDLQQEASIADIVQSIVTSSSVPSSEQNEQKSPESVEVNAVTEEPPAEPPTPVGEPEVPMEPTQVTLIGSLPYRLSNILDKIFSDTESHLLASCNIFFGAVRDVRYQLVQRRSTIRHTILTHLLRGDNRQSLFDAFRNGFNEFSVDDRYDVDVMNELHLRSVELRDDLLNLSESKQQQTLEILDKISFDGMINVFSHRCHCEAVAMLQSYISHFNSSLHVIFDYVKAVSGYDYHKSIAPELELVAPAEIAPSDDKKDKKGNGGAKAKNKAEGVSRDQVAPVVLRDEMNALPDPPTPSEAEEEKDVKTKKKTPKVRDVVLYTIRLNMNRVRKIK